MKQMKNNISSTDFDHRETNRITSSTTATLTNVSQYDETSSNYRESTRYSESLSFHSSMLFAVAQWFLNRESMSHKKLQKLCYYAYAWFIVFFNDQEDLSRPLNTLCSEGFEAWVHGPVCPLLYHRFKEYGWNDIPKNDEKPNLSSDVEDLLTQVWNTYGVFTADQLEQLTHNEAPWQEARVGKEQDEPSNKVIDDVLILKYYSKMMA